MSLPVFRTGSVSVLIIVLIAAALALFLSRDTAHAAPYNPTSDVNFCNKLPASFPTSIAGGIPALNGGSPACTDRVEPAGANPDFSTNFNIAGGNSNFGSSVITMSDTSFTVADIPGDGSIVGGLISQTTLGVIGSACSAPITVEFILYDSATGGALATNPEGTSNRWGFTGDGGAGKGGPNGIVTDAGADDFADATSAFVGASPDIYAPVFDPDLDFKGGPNGPKPPVTPKFRYTGATRVPSATGDWQLLSFFGFDPRQLEDFAKDPDNKPHQFAFVGATNWQMTLSLLNDASATAAGVSQVTDFCTPLLVTTMLKGVVGATPRFTTGAGSTHEFWQYSYGQRDADNDGIENSLDPCPFIAGTADTDGDRIPNACDTVVNTGFQTCLTDGTSLTDQDCDLFTNGQDNCPQVANATVADGGPGHLDSENQNTYTASAPDGGGKTDSIGDVCDPAPTTAFGQGGFATKTNINTVCIAAADANNNGICDGDETAPCAAGGPNSVKYSPDSDFDGWRDCWEASIGTNPLDKCANTAAANDEADDQWPPDFDDNKVINIVDVLAIKPVFGTPSARHDLNASGGNINIVDVLAIKPVFPKICSDRLTGGP